MKKNLIFLLLMFIACNDQQGILEEHNVIVSSTTSDSLDSTAELYIWIIFTEQVKENHKIMVLTK